MLKPFPHDILADYSKAINLKDPENTIIYIYVYIYIHINHTSGKIG